MVSFVDAFPYLFHVTRTSAVAGIQRDGLLPASAFLNRRSPCEPTANREGWTGIPNGDGQCVWLRWQNLRDDPLRKRLPATITPADWRDFINGMVFLFATPAKALALQTYAVDQAVAQTVICFRTAKVAAAGANLRVCRWNNGFLDRSKVPRLRTFDDYRPISEWRKGDIIQEVTATDGISARVGFEIIAG